MLFWITYTLAAAVLGAAFGRGRLLWLLLVGPPIFWMVWANATNDGPGDETTGLAALYLAVAGFIGVAAGAAIRHIAAMLRRLLTSN
jgi:hypothetical protein